MTVVELEAPEDKSRLCERVLADLPDWFGFEAVNAAIATSERKASSTCT
jgi:hypothetical protein